MMIFSYLPLAFITAFLFFQTALVNTNSSLFLGDKHSVHQITIYINEKDQDVLKSEFSDILTDIQFLSVNEQITDFKQNSLLEIDDVYSDSDLKDLLSPAVTAYLKNDADFNLFKDRIKNKPYILDYFYKGDWSDKLIKIKILIERYSTLFLILISIFIFIFTTLLLNHILLSKKESIEVYSVFGEQPSHIILPHIVKFLGIGILGWGSALAISLIIYRYIVDQLSQHQYFLFISQRLHFLSLSTIFISLIPYILSLVLSYYLFRKKIIHLYYSYEK